MSGVKALRRLSAERQDPQEPATDDDAAEVRLAEGAATAPSGERYTEDGGRLLGKGWTEHFDPDQGAAFYVHEADGVTSWEFPAELQPPPEGGEGAAGSQFEASPVLALLDEATGQLVATQGQRGKGGASAATLASRTPSGNATASHSASHSAAQSAVQSARGSGTPKSGPSGVGTPGRAGGRAAGGGGALALRPAEEEDPFAGLEDQVTDESSDDDDGDGGVAERAKRLGGGFRGESAESARLTSRQSSARSSVPVRGTAFTHTHTHAQNREGSRSRTLTTRTMHIFFTCERWRRE